MPSESCERNDFTTTSGDHTALLTTGYRRNKLCPTASANVAMPLTKELQSVATRSQQLVQKSGSGQHNLLHQEVFIAYSPLSSY